MYKYQSVFAKRIILIISKKLEILNQRTKKCAKPFGVWSNPSDKKTKPLRQRINYPEGVDFSYGRIKGKHGHTRKSNNNWTLAEGLKISYYPQKYTLPEAHLDLSVLMNTYLL